MPQVGEGSATVGQVDTGPSAKGAGLKAWAQALADALGIPVAEARDRIVAYRQENGGTFAAAAKAVAGKESGGGTSSGGSAGGGGGSDAGGGGSSGPSPESIKAAEATYANLLRGWGIPVKGAMAKLVAQAARAGTGSAAFLQALRRTKAYARAFPGIVRSNGTMRMTESQYMSGYQSARDFAASVGRGLTQAQYGLAVKNGNSPSEIKDKIQALDVLKTNRRYMEEFSDVLVAKGLVGPKGLAREDALAFIMGQGPREWEQTWDDAYQSAQLAKLQVDVGRPREGSDLSYRELEGLQRNLAPGEEPDYAALAGALQALPASQLYGYGLSKKDLVKLAYNAPGADQVAVVAKRALEQYKLAVTEPGAQGQIVQSQTGSQVLTGRRPQQATE